MSKVKICGLRRPEDIEAVNRALPDYVGFVFAAGSRRHITEETAAGLKAILHPTIQAAGVFVNQDIDWISSLCAKGVIDLVQLHGEEDDGYLARLRARCGCPVIRSVAVGAALPSPLPQGADYLLFDTASAQRGGAGQTFDWRLLQAAHQTPYFLAGGLAPENLTQVLCLLSPFCVDVSSGVETGGWKDPEKINQFVNLVRRNT